MRLHTLQIQNLNSLRGTHTVDFERLFNVSNILLIAGETGAGKSTILDAVHLALFGKTPRLPDSARSTSSEETSVQHVMTRGTGECSVCLEFSVQERNGTRTKYQALWSLHRAHKKADGRIQEPRHAIAQWNPQTEQFDDMLESGEFSSTSAARTHALRGMTEEDFLRSVLLPQGQFDALLTADEKTRADALKRIVPVEHIESIGRKVAQFASEAKRTLENEEQRLNAQQDELLSDQERDDYEQTLTMLANDLEAKQAEAKKVSARIQWQERCDELESALQTAVDNQTEVLNAYQEREDARQALKEHQRIESAAIQHQKCTELEQALRNQEQEAQSASQAFETEKQNFDAAQTAVTNAQAALNREIAGQTAQQEDLAAAIAAWKAHEAAISAHKQAQTDAARLKTAHDQEQERLAARQSAQTVAEREHKKLRDAIEQFAFSTAAQAAQPHIDALLRDEIERSATYRATHAPLNQAQTHLRALESERSADEAEQKKLDQERGNWRTKAQEFFDQAPWLEPPKKPAADASATQQVQTWIDTLATLQEQVTDYGTAFGTFCREKHAANECAAQYAEEEKRRKTIQAQAEAAREAVQKHRTAHETHVQLLQAHERAHLAQKRYLELVHELEHTDTCPVCGTHQPEQAAAERRQEVENTLQTIAKDIQKEQAAVEKAKNQVEQSTQAFETLREQCTRHETQVQQLQTQAQKHLDDAEKVRATLQDSPLYAAFAPAENDQDLPKQQESLRAQWVKIRDAIAAARSLVAERQTLDQRYAVLRQSQTTYQQRLKQAQEAVEKSQANQKNAEKHLRNWLERAHTAFETPDFLRWKPQHHTELTDQVQATKTKLSDLNQQLQRYAKTQEQFLSAQKTLATATSEYQTQKESYDRSKDAWEKALEHQQTTQTACEETLATTQRFFDGQHPDAIKQHWELTLTSLRTALEKERAAYTERQTQYHQAQTNLSNAETLVKNTTENLEAQENTLHRSLKSLALDSVQTLLERRLEPEYAQQLQQELQALERRKENAQTTREIAQKNLDQHLEQKAEIGESSQEDPSTLADLQQSIQEMLERRGAISTTLQKDQERKAALQEAGERLKKLQDEHHEWDLLRQLVGVKQGEAFSKFALALALVELIAHANEQLQIIAPRYTLQQRFTDAGIPLIDFEILDHDFTGDTRPITNLSGGERFQLSLAMALGLSSMSRSILPIETLLIDEGFGTLDPITLDKAIQTLEGLYQRTGARVALISHVERLRERLPTQIIVRKRGGGHSTLEAYDGLSGTI